MKELRIGLIGCGGIGAVHLGSWSQVEEAEVAAACDLDRSRAEATGLPAYGDFEEMLARAELDAVDICTPPHLHLPIARAAIERGLPVLCEKPLARNPAEAKEMVRAARAAGTVLMTGFCHRFHPPVQLVKGLIEAGEFGRVLMFRNRFGARFKGVEDRWFSNGDVAGGGALMDTSIHSVDLFRHLVGEVRGAVAAVRSFHPAITGVEDSGAMLLVGEDGAIGVIEASWMTPWSANVVEIYGESGAAVIDYDSGDTRYRRADDPGWTHAETGGDSRFVKELRHFAAVVGGDADARVTGEDGLRAIEVVYQAYGAVVR